VDDGGLGSRLGLLSAIPFLLAGAYLTWMTVSVSRSAASRAAMGTVLTLDQVGFTARMPQGDIAIPWGAVHSAHLASRGRHRILTFRLTLGTTPQSEGVRSTVTPAEFRVIAAKGFRLGSAGLDVPVTTIASAAAVFTGGRIAAR
jgi:hypothetical protein